MPAVPSPRAGLCAALFAAAAVPLAGCGRGQPAPQQPPPPAVTVARAVPYPVQSFYEYNGYLEAIEKVDVRARVKGYLDKVHFNEGDEVKPGDPLYTIDPREFQAGVAKSKADIAKAVADIATAKAQIKLAKADYERFAKLSGSASKTEVDKAAATVTTNEAQLDVATANKAAAEAALQTAELQLGYTDIRSPIAGRISDTEVTRGNLVGQTDATLLTTINSVDPLYVYFDAPEKDFVEYQRALQEKPANTPALTEFPVFVGVATEEGFPHAGEIDFRENRVDTGTGTVRVRGRVPNPAMPPGNSRVLYPGLYARVRVPNGPPKERLVLPEEALQTGQEGRFVFVIGKDSVVTKRTVTVGANVWRAPPPGTPGPPGWVLTNPNPKPPAAPPPGAPPAPPGPPPPTTVPARSIVAIEKGLGPDDLVIVNGLQKARPGAPVTPDLWDLKPPAK